MPGAYVERHPIERAGEESPTPPIARGGEPGAAHDRARPEPIRACVKKNAAKSGSAAAIRSISSTARAAHFRRHGNRNPLLKHALHLLANGRISVAVAGVERFPADTLAALPVERGLALDGGLRSATPDAGGPGASAQDRAWSERSCSRQSPACCGATDDSAAHLAFPLSGLTRSSRFMRTRGR